MGKFYVIYGGVDRCGGLFWGKSSSKPCLITRGKPPTYDSQFWGIKQCQACFYMFLYVFSPWNKLAVDACYRSYWMSHRHRISTSSSQICGTRADGAIALLGHEMSWDWISSVRIFLRWDWNTMVEPWLKPICWCQNGTFFHPPKQLSQTSCHSVLPGQFKLVGSLNIRKSFRMALEILWISMNYI